MSKNFFASARCRRPLAATLQKRGRCRNHGGRENDVDAETNTREEHLFLYCAFKNLNFCLLLQPFFLLFFFIAMIHDRLQVSADGHLKEKEKKEI